MLDRRSFLVTLPVFAIAFSCGNEVKIDEISVNPNFFVNNYAGVRVLPDSYLSVDSKGQMVVTPKPGTQDTITVFEFNLNNRPIILTPNPEKNKQMKIQKVQVDGLSGIKVKKTGIVFEGVKVYSIEELVINK
jgi:hypothetical protein